MTNPLNLDQRLQSLGKQVEEAEKALKSKHIFVTISETGANVEARKNFVSAAIDFIVTNLKEGKNYVDIKFGSEARKYILLNLTKEFKGLNQEILDLKAKKIGGKKLTEFETQKTNLEERINKIKETITTFQDTYKASKEKIRETTQGRIIDLQREVEAIPLTIEKTEKHIQAKKMVLEKLDEYLNQPLKENRDIKGSFDEFRNNILKGTLIKEYAELQSREVGEFDGKFITSLDNSLRERRGELEQQLNVRMEKFLNELSTREVKEGATLEESFNHYEQKTEQMQELETLIKQTKTEIEGFDEKLTSSWRQTIEKHLSDLDIQLGHRITSTHEQILKDIGETNDIESYMTLHQKYQEMTFRVDAFSSKTPEFANLMTNQRVLIDAKFKKQAEVLEQKFQTEIKNSEQALEKLKQEGATTINAGEKQKHLLLNNQLELMDKMPKLENNDKISLSNRLLKKLIEYQLMQEGSSEIRDKYQTEIRELAGQIGGLPEFHDSDDYAELVLTLENLVKNPSQDLIYQKTLEDIQNYEKKLTSPGEDAKSLKNQFKTLNKQWGWALKTFIQKEIKTTDKKNTKRLENLKASLESLNKHPSLTEKSLKTIFEKLNEGLKPEELKAQSGKLLTELIRPPSPMGDIMERVQPETRDKNDSSSYIMSYGEYTYKTLPEALRKRELSEMHTTPSDELDVQLMEKYTGLYQRMEKRVTDFQKTWPPQITNIREYMKLEGLTEKEQRLARHFIRDIKILNERKKYESLLPQKEIFDQTLSGLKVGSEMIKGYITSKALEDVEQNVINPQVTDIEQQISLARENIKKLQELALK